MTNQKKRPLSTALNFLLFSVIFFLLIAAFCFGVSFFENYRDGGEASVQNAEKPTVIIDAGHGGKDGGTVGIDKITVEKDLNLDIAKKMQSELTARGYRVIMTRSEDIMLSDPTVTSSKKAGDLSARLKIMQSVDNAVFISIHMNAFSDSRYSGLQVYYSANDARSSALALKIQSDVAKALQPENNRKIKNAGENIYLMKKAVCPAVLIECGFLSNSEECARLASEEYRKSLALVLCESIEEYICENH